MRKIKNYLTLINSVSLSIIAYLTFFLINLDTEKLNKKPIVCYISEHWNYLVAAIIIGFTFWWLAWSLKKKIKNEIKNGLDQIRVDFSNENGAKIESALELHKLAIPDLSISIKLMKNVVLPNIEKSKLSETLDKLLFNYPLFNIPELEKYGVDEYQIAKLREKYFAIELEKQKTIINQNKQV